nr:ABC transporter ATP-binding protein [Saprospiraceae bacterium]
MEPLAAHNLEANTKSRKEKAMHLLEKVGLKPEHFDRYPHQFSGGQRQRIVIARSLILEPKFLVCDESVSALDVSVQAQILNLLNDLKKEMGLSYLFISHDLSVVKHFCDRVMVMQRGKIVEEGDVEAVFHHPKSEYTRSLLDAVPGMA